MNLACISGKKFFDTHMHIYLRRYNQLVHPAAPADMRL